MLVWRWYAILDLFFGGLSAGVFISLAGLESFHPNAYFKKIKIWGTTTSVIFIVLGLITLILDLGRPERAYTTLLNPNPTSPLSWGTIVISLFTILSIIYWFILTGFIIKKLIPSLWSFLNNYKTIFVYLGSMAAFMTGTYTGILLTYSPYNLWNSPLLPILFLVSAIGMGYALFTILANYTGELEKAGLWQSLPKIMVILGVIELSILILYIGFLPTETQSTILSLGTTNGLLYTIIFIVGGVLFGMIVLPLVQMRTQKPSYLLYLSNPLVILGSFVLRYVTVLLGPAI